MTKAPDKMTEFPSARTIKWVDDDTGEEVGACEYIRADLHAELMRAADELAEQMRLIEKEAERVIDYDENDPIRMLDWFDTDWNKALDACRKAKEMLG